MRFEKFSFGSIRIDGITHEHDVVIDRCEVASARRSHPRSSVTPSANTPLSVEERIPRKCQRLVIGTGTGALPVMKEVKQEPRTLACPIRIRSEIYLGSRAREQSGCCSGAVFHCH